jgi:hypothetical protein
MLLRLIRAGHMRSWLYCIREDQEVSLSSSSQIASLKRTCLLQAVTD